tara:strand:- start:26988 stop:27242 length:255 start_codon:yes stop_codon:yes gene_type:complete
MSNADMPAMPQTLTTDSYGTITAACDYCIEYGGLTKREHFAAMAMQGICSISVRMPGNQFHFDNIAGDAVKQADALLKAMEQES